VATTSGTEPGRPAAYSRIKDCRAASRTCRQKAARVDEETNEVTNASQKQIDKDLLMEAEDLRQQMNANSRQNQELAKRGERIERIPTFITHTGIRGHVGRDLCSDCFTFCFSVSILERCCSFRVKLVFVSVTDPF